MAHQAEAATIKGTYEYACHGADGALKWTDRADNIIVNTGKNYLLDLALANSGTYVAPKMSLTSSGSASATSTYASPGVVEVTSAVIANRVTIAWTAASGGSKAASTTAFPITGTATVTGSMVVLTATTTPGDTAASGAILFSAAAFSGGSRALSAGDTLSVTYSISL